MTLFGSSLSERSEPGLWLLLTVGDQLLSDLPGEDGGVLPFVLFDLVDHLRCGHLGLAAADDARRSQRATCGRTRVDQSPPVSEVHWGSRKTDQSAFRFDEKSALFKRIVA